MFSTIMQNAYKPIYVYATNNRLGKNDYFRMGVYKYYYLGTIFDLKGPCIFFHMFCSCF